MSCIRAELIEVLPYDRAELVECFKPFRGLTSVDIDANAVVTINISKIVSATLEPIDANATVDIDVNKKLPKEVSIDAGSTVDISARKILNVDISIDATSSVSIGKSKIVKPEISIDATSPVSIGKSRIASKSISIDAGSTVDVSARKIVNVFDLNLDAESTFQAIPIKKASSGHLAIGNSVRHYKNGKTRYTRSGNFLMFASEASIRPIKILNALNNDIDAESSISVVANKRLTGDIDVDATASVTISVTVI